MHDDYRCISADPPWPEYGGGKIKRGAQAHYPLIKKKEDILRVMLQAKTSTGCSVWRPAADCHLWIWTTSNYLPWGLWLMGALGFTYKRDWAWVKAEAPKMLIVEGGRLSQESIEGLRSMFKLERPGLGQYSMGQHETLLLGARGATMKPASKDRPRSVILAPRVKLHGKSVHSAKPMEAYTDVIQKVSPGPRLEMFARDPREGWDAWGDECEQQGA